MNETQDDRLFIYRIDANDRIIFVNDHWWAFAAENEAAELALKGVLGHSLWNSKADQETQHLYKIILKRVREQQVVLTFPIRCDAPDCRRFMSL